MLKNHKTFKSERNNLKITKQYDNLKINDLNNNELKCKRHISFYGDRFIPRRCLNLNEENKKLFPDNNENTDILMWEPPVNYWLQNSIVELLKKAFCIKEKRILQFAKEHNESNDNLNVNKRDWKCKSRRKPFAYNESTHESIGLSDSFGNKNKMDWSINGQVVACFTDNVIIWKHIRDISIAFQVESANCLAYCPKGRYLAIGCKVYKIPVVELWDVNKYSVKIEVTWRYFFPCMTTEIECFEWSKCGKFIIAGTNKGNIYVFSIPYLKLIYKEEASKFPINTICFSSNMRYIACTDNAGNVFIYNWTNFKLNVHLYVRWKRNTKIMISWHPWHDNLAIAEKKSIIILNVPTKQIISQYRKSRKDQSIEINSLAFNKITAELCVSISKKDANGYTESKVIVLESFNRIVDVITSDYGARFLMWDPNGTKLVTAGIDNSLTIWRFYPDIKNKLKNKSNQNNGKLQNKLFYGCERGEKFKLYSNIR